LSIDAIDDTRAETRPALFSLPASAPAIVLRAGELLKGSGCKDGAIEIYEQFIRGMQHRVMCTIEKATTATVSPGDECPAEKLPDIFPVHSDYKRYSLA